MSRNLGKVKEFYYFWGIKINASKSEAICLRNASGKCAYFVVPESKRLKLFLSGVEIPFLINFLNLMNMANLYLIKLIKLNDTLPEF